MTRLCHYQPLLSMVASTTLTPFWTSASNAIYLLSVPIQILLSKPQREMGSPICRAKSHIAINHNLGDLVRHLESQQWNILKPAYMSWAWIRAMSHMQETRYIMTLQGHSMLAFLMSLLPQEFIRLTQEPNLENNCRRRACQTFYWRGKWDLLFDIRTWCLPFNYNENNNTQTESFAKPFSRKLLYHISIVASSCQGRRIIHVDYKHCQSEQVSGNVSLLYLQTKLLIDTSQYCVCKHAQAKFNDSIDFQSPTLLSESVILYASQLLGTQPHPRDKDVACHLLPEKT